MAHTCQKFRFCQVCHLCGPGDGFGLRLRLLKHLFTFEQFADICVDSANTDDEAVCVKHGKLGNVIVCVCAVIMLSGQP